MKKYLYPALFLVGSFAFIGGLSSFTPHLETLEYKTYDFMMKVLRGPRAAPPDIVVVAIDQASIDEFSDRFQWPWPRSVHGELIRLLNEAGARAVIFDVVFDLETQPDEDAALAGAIKASRAPVVLAATVETVRDPRYDSVKIIQPQEKFVNAGAKAAYATLNLDQDNVLRRARLYLGDDPTLASAALMAAGIPLDLHNMPILTSAGDPEILVNYLGGTRSVPTVSYYQALDYQSSLPKGIFADKFVFVGRALTIQDIGAGQEGKDAYASPFDLVMPGVEIHAHTLDTLLRRNFIERAGTAPTWSLILLPSLLITVVVVVVQSFRLKIWLSLAIVAATVVTATAAFVFWRYWIFTAQPVAIVLSVFVLNTLHQYRAGERERAVIRKALTGYVSKQVMHQVLKNPAALELGGVQLQATVLFSDIAGFSKISEGITPRELAAMLNDYFTRMGDAIMGRNGMINKYIGDAIMAIWGAPLEDPDHATQACLAALEMKRIVEGMGGPIRARIGINTGPMVAGNLGHHDRMEYTVIGDAVNLASRLEGANKAFGTSIMISETTEDVIRGRFLVRPLDRIRVVGKQLPVRVFELVGGAEAMVSADGQFRSFDAILGAYEARDWAAACDLTEQHLASYPSDTVARTYLERCRKFRATPPPADWDGVYALEAK